jgi:starch synthase
MNKQSMQQVVSLALVHHANQYLITNDYDDRQGICQIVEGYTHLLQLHEKYDIPLNLHLSGTLMETLAWHCPWFFALVRAMREQGLLSLIGGTYAENVMTLFEPSFNLQQLNEHIWLYRQHMHCKPTDIKVCWVPERVWNGVHLADVVTSDLLANGGYRYVLLDDRLLYPTYGIYRGSLRALFDSIGPYSAVASMSTCPSCKGYMPSYVKSCQVYRIAGTHHLVMIPISANLRYWIPPACNDHWQHLETTIRYLAHEQVDDVLLVYADDLEKAAGVGGWDACAPERYEVFLSWIASRSDLIPIHLSGWLECHPPREEHTIEEGSFFEVAQERRAGENYRGWAEDVAWLPYQRILKAAQDALQTAQHAGVNTYLMELARKHLMASTYETAWHDVIDGEAVPAAWAKAIASHARAIHVMIAAAHWFAQDNRPMLTEAVDIDNDGEEEVILRSATMYAVLSPHQGARLTYLFMLMPKGGVLVIGNPTDDWNLQQELNAYMQQPPNHPGALADKGYERDDYCVVAMGHTIGVKMMNVQAGSHLYGAHKSICLLPQSNSLAVCYCLPDSLKSLDTVICFSPDYYRLLREGPAHLHPIVKNTRRGFSDNETAVWIALPDDEEACWVHPIHARVGHGMNVQIRLCTSHVHLLIGCDEVNDETCQWLLQQGRSILDT